jgi:hypothetical protein
MKKETAPRASPGAAPSRSTYGILAGCASLDAELRHDRLTKGYRKLTETSLIRCGSAADRFEPAEHSSMRVG